MKYFSIVLLILFSVLASALVSRWTMERLPHLEDEFAYLFQARIFQKGAVYIDTPQPANPYWQPFLINLDGKRFSKYPPAWSLLLALGTGLKLPWVVNTWLAGLNVALVYRFTRELYGGAAGLVAGLLLSLSPIALILNASLMSHTSALFLATLFMYGLWRIERGRRVLLWGGLAGAALGLLIANRPLAAVGVALPFVVYSAGRVVFSPHIKTLVPLLMVAAATLLWALPLPLYNHIVSGSPNTNLYTLIWSYDRVGFGEGHGRQGGQQVFNLQENGVKINMTTHQGHTLSKGWSNLKRDTACYARDLFGWVEQPDQPPSEILRGNECLVDRRGYSWLLLPFGLLLMPRRRWSLLLVAAAASVLLVHMAYWIGAGVYSARYYFEASAALVMVSAAGVEGLRRWGLGWGVYALLGVLLGVALLGYTPRRLAALRGYGDISQADIQAVQALRHTPDTPVLVIGVGDLHWRQMGALFSLTDPYTTAPIIGLRDTSGRYVDLLAQRYPERQVILLIDGVLYPLFPE